MFDDVFIWFKSFQNAGLLGFCFILFEFFLTNIGETNPYPLVKNAQANKDEVYFFQEFKNNIYEVKLKCSNEIKPEIVSVGSSRVNAFRQDMFGSHTFYNFSNVINNFSRSIGLLKTLDSTALPKVMLVLVEPFHFKPNHSSRDTSANDFSFDARLSNVLVFQSMIDFEYSDFSKATWENIGMKAIINNRGFRPQDGSVFWGKQCFNSIEKQIRKFDINFSNAEAKLGKQIFKNLNTSLSEEAFDEFEQLVKYAKEKGITIVGITPPLSQPLQKVFDSDPIKYQIWHEFQKKSTSKKLKNISGFYYNFSRFETSHSNYYEMLDFIHPSEKIVSRILIEMYKDESFRSLLPGLDVENIKIKIESSPFPANDIFTER